jgi:iron complex transport system permease protein
VTPILDSSPAPAPARVPGRTPLRIGPFSTVLRPRPLLVLCLALLALFAVFVLSLGLGTFRLTPAQVLDTLFGGGVRADHVVIFELRMPRVAAALLVGAALGLSGAIIQTIARNPLASPDTLGITWGAGTAVTAAIVLGTTAGDAMESVGLPAVALLGGVLTGLVVFLLAYRDGLDSFRLVLVGVGVMTFTGSATVWLLSVGEVNDAGRAMVWLTGSLSGQGWENVRPLAVVLAVLVPLTVVGSRTLGALQFDDDTVRAVGVRLDAARAAMLLAAVVLASAATALAGPIQFVALCAPHVALRLARASRPPLVLSMALAALLVSGADLIARTAFGSLEMPVGIVTAVLGAPYLIHLIVRRHREARA